jgi:hypothetical protein
MKNRILNLFCESLIEEGYSYHEVANTDSEIVYEFTSGELRYSVVFEYTGQYGWEMMFGIVQDDGTLDTKVITNKPGEVMKILNTIFGDILKEFVNSSFKYEDSLDILLAPQLMEGELDSVSPFERKRGKLYVRKIKEFINNDRFWDSYDVTFSESSFTPKCIIMSS